MSQEYSDPERASDPYALPDIEIWNDFKREIECKNGCGLFDIPDRYSKDTEYCVSCEREGIELLETSKEVYWWYWYCLPGCLPDGTANGPFETREEALANARAE